MSLITRRVFALLVALAFIAAGGRGAVLAQDDDVGPAGRPPIGTPIPYISDEGNEIGLMTITEVVDPFTDHDPNSPPPAGSRYVEVGLSVEATGRRPFEFNPYSIYIQDSDGVLYTTTFLFRDSELTEERPDFVDSTVGAGDTVSGYLYFDVFEDAAIARVVYTDGYTRLIFLADLTAEGSVITPGGGGDDDEDGDDGDDGDGGTTLSDEECDEVANWYDDFNTRLATIGEAFDALSDPTALDAESARDLADQLADAADEQADADVPEAAQAANDALVAGLEALADVFDGFADTLEAGDELTDEAVIAAFTEVEPALTEATDLLEELETACDLL